MSITETNEATRPTIAPQASDDSGQLGEIYVMDRSGHRSSFKWGQTPAEIEMAKKTFDEYVAKGFTMYRLKRGGLRGRKITEFEPDARAILAVPRMVGG